MKKFRSTFSLWFAALFLLGIGGLSACNPDDEEEQSELSRMFMPTGVIGSTTGETQVRLSWKPSLYATGTITYTVEVAADTLFATPVIYTGVTDTASIVLTDDQIPTKQKFFARVKTNGQENTPESKWLVSNGFSIRGVQAFTNVPVNSADVTDRSVRLRFTPREGITRIVVTPMGGTAQEITLSASDLAAGFYIADNLTGGTNYNAEIFAGTKSYGITTFQTKQPLSGNIIDLRGITGRPAVLQDTITQIENGSTIILKRGQTYTIAAATNLSKSVTITSGSDLTEPNPATIYFTSNFGVVAGSSIDHIIIKDVNLTGSDATAKYVFNINTASTIGTVTFDNVKASMFRGFFRLQTQPTTITTLTLNNSVIDSIGGFGVVNVDLPTSQIQNILITNSTISKAEKVISSKNNSTSVLFENVTVNESPSLGNYLVDYSTSGANNVTNGVKIRNTILGIGKAGNQGIKGVRAGTSTLVEVANSFSTADYMLAPTSNFAIPGLTAYSATSLALWQNPKNGDFHFRDAAFPGKDTSGDPRWR
ncbi:DUF5123 domain-containing protein [Rufibacter latericius]|uniref:DUF5123 domain-containing protein n=1 Tax=Rufibacter latericius TaxID=2487040 RepID=A0A3M9M8T0_9BACT|nr:DUF5123 domain-containing protein [Rufibacter latericius]RNI21961.1 DUF5123 domain-containing protein [Rufibacter latericius]